MSEVIEPDTRTGARRRWSAALIKAMLIAGIAAALLLAASRFDVVALPQQIVVGWLLVAVLAQLLNWLIASLAWRAVLEVITGIAIPVWDCFCQVAMLLTGKYIPGKVWGVVARSEDLVRLGVARRENLVAAYIEQIVALHAGVVLGVVAWVVSMDSPYLWPVVLLALFSIVVAALFHSQLLALLLHWLRRRYASLDEVIALVDLPKGRYLRVFMIYVVEWLSHGLVLVLLAAALLDTPLDANRVLLLLSVNAMAMSAGFVALFAPGGIGVREGVMVLMLGEVMAVPEATLLAIVYRLWTVVADALAAALVLGVSLAVRVMR